MAKSANNVRAYGDTSVVVGPVGYGFPTDPTTVYSAGVTEVGWLSEDGITETFNRDKKDVKANGGKVVRVIRTADGRTFKFQCLEQNAVVMGLIRPGSTPITTAGTAEVQTVTLTGTGTAGVWALTLPGYGTASGLAYNTSMAALQTALAAAFGFAVGLPTGTPGTSYVVNFGALAGNVPTMTAVNNITGITAIGVAVTTPGTNGYTTTAVKSSTSSDRRAFGLDMTDGDIVKRITIANGEVTNVSDVSYKGSDETIFELEITPYPDSNNVMYNEYIVDPAVAV